jgi:hypothetical protein
MDPGCLQGVGGRPERQHPQSMRTQEGAAAERWEDEGGAIARMAAGLRFVRTPNARSHHFGEGQIARTITQDEQDRLAGRS